MQLKEKFEEFSKEFKEKINVILEKDI